MTSAIKTNHAAQCTLGSYGCSLSDRSDLFTLPLAAGSVCFDILLSPLVLTPIVCVYRISCMLYIDYSIVYNDGRVSAVSGN